MKLVASWVQHLQSSAHIAHFHKILVAYCLYACSTISLHRQCHLHVTPTLPEANPPQTPFQITRGSSPPQVPVTLKDVAGLVPGAYQGRGRGNAFLNDLCDADVLVHVVDASGSTDREGGATKEGEGADPLEEVG